MRPRFFLLLLRRAQYAAVSLVAVLAVSSCAPAAGTSPPITPTDTLIPATARPADSPSPEATATPQEATPTQSAEVQAVATSRGPNLEATDPSTVALASGQLQLVEFFRFT